VFALKESAKRTHYQLGKFVKKFRVGLSTKVKEILLLYHETLPLTTSTSKRLTTVVDKFMFSGKMFYMSGQFYTSISSELRKDSRLREAEKYFARSESLVRQVYGNEEIFNTALNTEELTEEILERIKDFQALNSSLEGKSVKGQKIIRKKAWVDLLKRLSLVGLSPRCSQRFAIQQDPIYLNSLRKVDFSQLASVFHDIATPEVEILPLCEKADDYYHRSLARVAVVRKLVTSISPDVSQIEVEKAISFLDDLTHIAIEERESFANYMADAQMLKECINQMETLRQGKMRDFAIMTCTSNKLSLANAAMNAVYVAVVECQLVCDSVTLNPVSGSLLSFLKETRSIVYSAKISLDSLSGQKVFSATSHVLHEACESAYNILRNLHSESIPQLGMEQSDQSFILHNLQTVASDEFEKMRSYQDLRLDAVSLPACLESVESCLERTMLTIQQFMKPELATEKDSGDIIETHNELCRAFGSKHLNVMAAQCESVFVNLARLGESDISEATKCVLNVYPIMKQCLLMVQYRLFEFGVFHKTLTKFTYILTNTFYSVIKDGFCVPEGEEDDSDDTLEDDVAGMGIGEGDGKKDVSEEIETEDQVEGLQNEEAAPPPEKEIKDEKEGIEMQADFDGKMEGLEMSETENDEDEEEGNPDDVEEQMGDLDDDLASVVDEKLWDGDGANEGDEKTERDGID
jgi:midasin